MKVQNRASCVEDGDSGDGKGRSTPQVKGLGQRSADSGLGWGLEQHLQLQLHWTRLHYVAFPSF